MERDLFGISYLKTEEFIQKDVDCKAPHTMLHLSGTGGVTPTVLPISLSQERRSQQEIFKFQILRRYPQGMSLGHIFSINTFTD